MKHLFHITHYGRLPTISKLGLLPDEEPYVGAESRDSTGPIFLTPAASIAFWAAQTKVWTEARYENPKEALAAPVLLRVPGHYARLSEHDVSAARASHILGYRCALAIPPCAIQLWAGTPARGRWVGADDWREVPFDEAFDRELEDGEAFYYLREVYPSPLLPAVQTPQPRAHARI